MFFTNISTCSSHYRRMRAASYRARGSLTDRIVCEVEDLTIFPPLVHLKISESVLQ